MITQSNGIRRDLVILEVVLLKVARYLKNELYIGDLINELENLLNQLTTADEDWKTEFRTLWFDLESCYAMSFVDDEVKDLTKEDTQIVEDSLHEINTLVEEKMQELRAEISTPDKLACRVCGKLQSDLPWGEDGETPTFDVCYCCGVQFGYEDCDAESLRKFRQTWLAKGANWFVPEEKPDKWELEEQMKKIPERYRFP